MLLHKLTTLAQQPKSAAVGEVVVWVIALIVAVIVLGIVLMQLRRLMREGDKAKTQGLLLDDLRRLRDEGLLTSEEYHRAVDAMASRMSASAGTKASAE